jgi:hypothetical protein
VVHCSVGSTSGLDIKDDRAPDSQHSTQLIDLPILQGVNYAKLPEKVHRNEAKHVGGDCSIIPVLTVGFSQRKPSSEYVWASGTLKSARRREPYSKCICSDHLANV